MENNRETWATLVIYKLTVQVPKPMKAFPSISYKDVQFDGYEEMKVEEKVTKLTFENLKITFELTREEGKFGAFNVEVYDRGVILKTQDSLWGTATFGFNGLLARHTRNAKGDEDKWSCSCKLLKGENNRGKVTIFAECTGFPAMIEMLKDADKMDTAIENLHLLSVEKIYHPKLTAYLTPSNVDQLSKITLNYLPPPKEEQQDNSTGSNSLESKRLEDLLLIWKELLEAGLDTTTRSVIVSSFSIAFGKLIELKNKQVNTFMDIFKQFFTSHVLQKSMAGFIPLFLQIIKEDYNLDIKLKVFDLFMYFDTKHQEEMVKNQIFEVLIGTLKSDNQQLQSKAIEMLKMFDVSYQKILVTDHKILNQIFHLMKSDSKPYATTQKCISLLFYFIDYKKKVIKEKIPEVLIELLINGTNLNIEKSAFEFLLNLCKSYEKKLVEAGFLKVVLHLLTSSNINVRSAAYECLVLFKSNYLEELKKEGMINTLIKVISDPTQDLRTEAFNILQQLSVLVEQKQLVESGILEALDGIISKPIVLVPQPPLKTMSTDNIQPQNVFITLSSPTITPLTSPRTSYTKSGSSTTPLGSPRKNSKSPKSARSSKRRPSSHSSFRLPISILTKNSERNGTPRSLTETDLVIKALTLYKILASIDDRIVLFPRNTGNQDGSKRMIGLIINLLDPSRESAILDLATELITSFCFKESNVEFVPLIASEGLFNKILGELSNPVLTEKLISSFLIPMSRSPAWIEQIQKEPFFQMLLDATAKVDTINRANIIKLVNSWQLSEEFTMKYIIPCINDAYDKNMEEAVADLLQLTSSHHTLLIEMPLFSKLLANILNNPKQTAILRSSLIGLVNSFPSTFYGTLVKTHNIFGVILHWIELASQAEIQVLSNLLMKIVQHDEEHINYMYLHLSKLGKLVYKKLNWLTTTISPLIEQLYINFCDSIIQDCTLDDLLRQLTVIDNESFGVAVMNIVEHYSSKYPVVLYEKDIISILLKAISMCKFRKLGEKIFDILKTVPVQYFFKKDTSSAPKKGSYLLPPEIAKQMNTWITNNVTADTKWELLYDAKRHGFSNVTFHTRIGLSCPTITIVRVVVVNHVPKDPKSATSLVELLKDVSETINDESVFGAYSPVAFQKDAVPHLLHDSQCFLFSITDGKSRAPVKLRLKPGSFSHYSGKQLGPSFGIGDLWLDLDNPGACYSNLGHSFQLPNSVKFMSQEAQQFLAGVSSPWEIRNVEVYSKLNNASPCYETSFPALHLLLKASVAPNVHTKYNIMKLIRNCFQYNHHTTEYELQQIIDSSSTEPKHVDQAQKLKVLIGHPGYAFLLYTLVSRSEPVPRMEERSNPFSVTLKCIGEEENPLLTHIRLRATPSLKETTTEAEEQPIAQWSWRNDANAFIPYDEETTLIIEAAYRKDPNGTCTLTHGTYATTGGYILDFAKNEQQKIQTKYIRIIKRTEVKSSPRQEVLQSKRHFLIFLSNNPTIDTDSFAFNTIEDLVASQENNNVVLISNWIWCSSVEKVLLTPTPAKYIHIKCFSDRDSTFHASSFEFFGYLPSLNSGKPPDGSIKGETLWKSQTTLNFEPTFPFSPGLIHWIGTEGTTTQWKNPHAKLKLTLSHSLHQSSMIMSDVLNIANAKRPTYWGSSSPQWFSIDLGPTMRFNPTAFSLRHGYNQSNSFPLDISFAASQNHISWTVLDKVIGSPFTQPFEAHTFTIPKQKVFFRYFKVSQPQFYGMGAVGGTGSAFFCVAGFELYGQLLEGSLSAHPEEERDTGDDWSDVEEE